MLKHQISPAEDNNQTAANAADGDRSSFARRHIGPSAEHTEKMLAGMGYTSLEDFTDKLVPASIRDDDLSGLPEPASEEQALDELKGIAARNQVHRSFIGQGYYGTYTPAVIQRNVFENPAWYTAYTPYQPEISQGRLEALLNFQTMICELTNMDIANASMLDEATASAEAMALCRRMSRVKSSSFFVDEECMPQTIDVIMTRAAPLNIQIELGPKEAVLDGQYFGALFANPGASGAIVDLTSFIDHVHSYKGLVAVTTDLLASVMCKPAGDMGADVVVGNTQRFGVPLGFGGPHAAFMATTDKLKRSLPGRIVGVSVDRQGNTAYRLALQTREQHIRREKATSNICTAQVLLAVIAGMYAVYHGPSGLQRIASNVHSLTDRFARSILALGFRLVNDTWFDTLTVATGTDTAAIHARAHEHHINLRVIDDEHIGVSFDQTCTTEHVQLLLKIFHGTDAQLAAAQASTALAHLPRTDKPLRHPVFYRYRSETDMLRYLRLLADKDIALDRSMIPLGSCTMKLNASAEMLPVSWPEFANIHPFAPDSQAQGYATMILQLEQWLCKITGYAAVSLQPNAGSQGEFAGLLAIRAYHESRSDTGRNICLIPASAHGTNPASAQMCGMQVVVVACDDNGYIDLDDLRAKASNHSANLAAIMITYPSTYGVFEEEVGTVCDIVHEHGGQVYIDGANLNALVGLAKPGHLGGDVSHLNLHKTFCIPHGGGGPGVGPIGVAEHLKPFLPGHRVWNGESSHCAVSAAPWGSASILPISWMYIRMMGAAELRKASQMAALAANYVVAQLKDHYRIQFTDKAGLVAHECIIDFRQIEERTGISAEDVAKRLIDFGFHAPTMSFPVAGTLMIEPTESESLEELKRFITAMIQIRGEIDQVESRTWPADNNPLVNAPHSMQVACADEWPYPYSRTSAVYPVPGLRTNKYWSPVSRVDNVYGDRNLMCSCPPLSAYTDE
ncbi:MAG: aminomethyl-transferring glycine dehydrogenase [Gammaproteobacteria bacterium]|nr:aminomethyl-transferring glycine dehydrogenase [Gammaproteobacteria bacterium]